MRMCQLGMLYKIFNEKRAIIHKGRIKINNILVDLIKNACYYK